jgi:hypothetical protein
MFVLVEKLLVDFHLRKQSGLVQILQWTRPFMLPSLLEINTIAGTIERHFALLATTLRADASVDGGTKAFLFSLFADRAAHEWDSRNHYDMQDELLCASLKPASKELASAKSTIFVGFFGS